MKLIKVFATWCQPCTALSAVLHGINHPLVQSMESLDIDKNPEFASDFGIRSLPTLLLIDEESGGLVKTLVGLKTKEQILEFLEHGE